ncbi:sensor histidine kinase [Falsirhodobacter algicola]|uniref:histidine kinase n=1 Tax=Falsirhodobacter algicola TaxID=2692330 RepID=A0A8J8SKS5_9RHOB|nr:histidine kinase dimerization/phospho-acceptor domain-containing protein [Falsirhodobacter algicola]QUS35683.1 two-component sensor histidine kinase [Falsirhodobacter algicola]
MSARSLRRDLAIGLGAGLTVLWILAMLGATLILREELGEVYDSLMEETADRLLPFMGAEDIADLPPRAEVLLTWALHDAEGMRFSDDADPADFAPDPPEGFSTARDQRHFVRRSGGRVLDIASPLQERREALREVMTALILPALALLPLCLWGIVWFTNRRLRPVADLSTEVAGRSPGDLQALTTPALPAELLPVRDEMNRLMADLSEALAAERAFSANAAHELRTPIAATLAHVQLLRDAADGPLRDRADKAEGELKRVTRLAEKLLQLARAEHAGFVSGPVDVAPILQLVARDFGMSPEIPAAPVVLRIDPDAFAILARNLIENAVHHGRNAEIRLQADGTLVVANDGPVVPPGALAHLTRRFERAGARNAGSGLGLAIVAAVAGNAGFDLTLRSPRQGSVQGFEAIVGPKGGQGAGTLRR